MDVRLQEVVDHHEIRQVLAIYCHGCDRGDEVEMAGTYCEDSWDDHGIKKMPGLEFSIDTVNELQRTTNVVSHLLGQSLIRVNGDDAGAETYFIATLVYPADEGGESLSQLGGRYVDTLRREKGKWFIKKRTCVRDWSITHPVAMDMLVHHGFVQSCRSQADESYRALDIVHSGNPWLGLQARIER